MITCDTSKPEWHLARSPEDIIPDVPDPFGKGARFLRLTNLFLMTQGNCAGDRFGDHILPWQTKLTVAAHSGLITETGIKCGKGSGKSLLMAAWAQASLMDFVDRGVCSRSYIIVLSANVDGARIVFNHVIESVLADEHLRDDFKTNVGAKELIHKTSGITIKCIAPTMANAIGKRISRLYIDEIHQGAIENRDFGSVVDQLRRGGQNFDEEFLQVGVTTAPEDRAAGYYAEWLEKMRAIRDRRVTDNRTLPVLYEFPLEQRKDLDPEEPVEWWRGMPSLITPDNPKGTIRIEAIHRELEEAVRDSEIGGMKSLSRLMSQRLGIEPEERRSGGLTRAADLWPDAEMTWPNPASDLVVIALDPSAGLSDPFALVYLTESAGTYYTWDRQYLQQVAYNEAPEKLRRVYDQAIKAQELVLCETTTQMETQIFELIRHLQQKMGSVTLVCGGDAAGLGGFTERFETTAGEYIPVRQNWERLQDLERLEGLLHDRSFKHTGQPLYSFNIRNLRIDGKRFMKADGNASNVGHGKIDAAMALLSAIHLHSQQPVFDASAMIA